jgi:predicted nucleotidyltransferase
MHITEEPVANAIFGSSVKRKILQFLFSSQSSVSERGLARVIGASHVSVNKAMKRLEDLNVVKHTKVGNSIVWQLNEDSFARRYIGLVVGGIDRTPIEYVKRKIRDSIALINGVLEYAESQAPPKKNKRGLPRIREAYIFGSVAAGTSSPESDIDVLLVLDPPGDRTPFDIMLMGTLGSEVFGKIGSEMSFHTYGRNEVARNKPQWLRKAITDGIRVY